MEIWCKVSKKKRENKFFKTFFSTLACYFFADFATICILDNYLTTSFRSSENIFSHIILYSADFVKKTRLCVRF